MNKRIFALLSAFLFIAFAGFFCLRSSLAQGPEETTAYQLFYQANAAYKEGKYDAAIENYEKLIGLGLENGSVYYNLGNSYFKKGEPGEAILNYERAKFFIPNDSDLKANQDYVLSLLNLEPQSPGNSLEKVINRLFEGATVNFLTIFLSVIYILLMGALILNLFLSEFKKFIQPLVFILSALIMLSAISLRSKIIYYNKGAIVISKVADVKFEPLESGTTYFKLAEGSQAKIMEKTESWYKIKRPDGKAGWVNKAALGRIVD